MTTPTLCFRLIFLVVMVGYVDAGRIAFGGSAAFATHSPKRQDNSVVGQPPYQIASVDLSSRWVDLVREGKVAATVSLLTEDSEVAVRYGVRLATRGSETRCEEFVEEAGLEQGESTRCDLIRTINETLASDPSSTSTQTVKFAMDGDFAAQLQLVRTLRPPPSPGFTGSATSIPPPYDSSTDSFVTGPLRLELRPLVGSLELSDLTTPWDVFHNVSPADTRGHFLLLPTLSDEAKNWRGQLFSKDDCNDMVHLANSIQPVGSLLLGFNSVGAGASQNHIHCHAWPSPPIPLKNLNSGENDNGEVAGWNSYAVSKVESIYDFYDIDDGKVEVSYLKYPVFCLQLSASPPNLDLLGKALAAALEAVGDAPYNIGFLNRRQEQDDDDETFHVDVFLFARSKERSDVLPSFKLGISEMMGVFHAQSDSELKELTCTTSPKVMDTSWTPPTSSNKEDGVMALALADVSFEAEEDLWDSIKDNLMKLDESG